MRSASSPLISRVSACPRQGKRATLLFEACSGRTAYRGDLVELGRTPDVEARWLIRSDEPLPTVQFLFPCRSDFSHVWRKRIGLSISKECVSTSDIERVDARYPSQYGLLV